MVFIHNKKRYEKNVEYISNEIFYEILNEGNFYEKDYFSELVVPRDNYFVLGDHRDRSLDSRYFGTFHKSKILDKYIFFQSQILNRTLFFILVEYDLKE